MVDELEDIDLSIYPVLSSDGAYVHYNDGIVRMMFYRNFVFPTHGSNESIVFDKKKREIVQEIRLSKVAATQVSSDLKNVLYIPSQFDPHIHSTMEDTHEAHKEQFRTGPIGLGKIRSNYEPSTSNANADNRTRTGQDYDYVRAVHRT
jgi:hypothetical protein